MAKIKKLFIIWVAGLASCARPVVKADASISSLCARLPSELEFIHKTMVENNSNYNGSGAQRIQSDLAFKNESARQCQDDLDYVHAVRRYLASYRDPHVTSLWTTPSPMQTSIIEASTGSKPPPQLVPLKWTATGIYLQRFNERYFVKRVDPKVLGSGTALIAGDELKMCDGKSPGQILEDEILPFVSVSAKTAAMYRYTPFVFARWDKKLGDATNCQVEREGSEITVTLNWHPVPEDYIQKTFQPPPTQIYEREKTPYGHWIKLKSLGGYDKAAIAQLQHFTEDAKELRKDKIIVMDLRGNSGGSSNWGTDWIDNLYGYHADFDRQIQESVFVSAGNRAHFERFYHILKGSGGIETAYAKGVWENLIDALHKAPLGTFAALTEPPAPQKPRGQLNFKGQVIVLTDSGVFSSGETFLEQLKMMPGVKQAGIPSNASTYFSDIRFVLTPAGLPFNFPTKMDSGDPLNRKSGEALKPDWPISYEPKVELAGVDTLRRALEKKIMGMKM